MISALYVIKDGPYFNIENVDPWDADRNAKIFKGPGPVIAHPPCQRWGRYWGGGPMLHGTEKQKLLGDDEQCFAHALWAVRSFGGVLEHPEASIAWKFFGLPKPDRSGGWTGPDAFGGYACCVSQGHYGHRAQKLTWLYAVRTERPDLIWGKCPGKDLMDEGFHSKEERARKIKTGICQRISKRQREGTPSEFKELLISIAETVHEHV